MIEETNLTGDPEPPGDGTTDATQPVDDTVTAYEQTSALGDPEPPGSTGDPEPPGGSTTGSGSGTT